jgi:hypothetical protein
MEPGGAELFFDGTLRAEFAPWIDESFDWKARCSGDVPTSSERVPSPAVIFRRGAQVEERNIADIEARA